MYNINIDFTLIVSVPLLVSDGGISSPALSITCWAIDLRVDNEAWSEDGVGTEGGGGGGGVGGAGDGALLTDDGGEDEDVTAAELMLLCIGWGESVVTVDAPVWWSREPDEFVFVTEIFSTLPTVLVDIIPPFSVAWATTWNYNFTTNF